MKLRALLFATALLVPFAGSALADQPTGGMRVAVVDVQRAMMQTEDGLRVQATLKKEFDKKYNPTWHCVVGRNFGSYVTHETKHFIYFYLDRKSVV